MKNTLSEGIKNILPKKILEKVKNPFEKIAQLSVELADKTRRLRNRRRITKKYKEEFEIDKYQLNHTINKLNHTINDLNAELVAKDKIIERLNQNISNYNQPVVVSHNTDTRGRSFGNFKDAMSPNKGCAIRKIQGGVAGALG